MHRLTALALLIAASLASCSPTAARSTPTTTAPPTAQPTRGVTSQVLTGPTDRVALLAWAPDGSRLASASGLAGSDLDVRLWDASGASVASLVGHTQHVLSLAWSPDGSTLVSGAADETIRFWSRDGKLIRTQEVRHGNVWAVAWSPDGSLVATGSIIGTLNPMVEVWKADGTLLWQAQTQFSGGKFYNLLWSPDGALLLGGATDYLLWTRDGKQVAAFPGCAQCAPKWGAAWSPDGSTLAIGDENGTLALYDRTGMALNAFQSTFDVNSIAWSPDGKLIAGGPDLRTSTGRRLANVPGAVSSVAWSPDGHYLAVAADKLITLLRPDGTRAEVLSGHTDIVNWVAWSPRGLLLASASDDHTVRLWTLPSAP